MGVEAITVWLDKGFFSESMVERLEHLENGLLSSLGALAHQLLHVLRTVCFTGDWRSAYPKRLRRWFFGLPGKLTTHAREHYLQPLGDEPFWPRLLRAFRVLAGGLPPSLTTG